MAYTRARLLLESGRAVSQFVKELNSDGSTNKWMLENFDGSLRVDARSLLGAMYAATDWDGEIYLVNASHEDCIFPDFIDKYRA